MRRVNTGFTLMELMITVAIIGILTGIAYPSYLKQVQKTNRSDAKVILSDVAQRMQRCFTAHSTYSPEDEGVCKVVDDLQTSDGIKSAEGFYTVKAAAADLTAVTYLLTATPIAGERQENDEECASLTLNQAGVRAAFDEGGDDTTDFCW